VIRLTDATRVTDATGGELPGWVACAIALLRYGTPRRSVPPEVDRWLREQVPEHSRRLAEKRIDSLYYLGWEPENAIQALYDFVWGIQRAHLEQLLKDLESEGIDALVLKGAEVFPRCFGDHPIGFMSDVDVLVDRQKLGFAKKVLYAQGYRQATYDQESGTLVDVDIGKISEVEGRHYELVPFCKLVPTGLSSECARLDLPAQHPLRVSDNMASVLVEVDVHHRVALDVESAPFFARGRTSALGVGRAISPEDHLWVLTARLYNEVALHGKSDLRDLAYAAAIVRCEAIDWDVVLHAATEQDLHPSLFYYLSFLHRVADLPVPIEILDRMSPLRGVRFRDWGWQLGRLLDFVEPCPIKAS